MDDSEFYTVGVDLGQSRDPTAIAILRKAGDLYQLGHLERLPLQTPYPRIVDHVIERRHCAGLRGLAICRAE
jgi:hypothetical protein